MKFLESCIQQPLLGKLSASQLARILKRSDLCLSREESVLKGIFNWLKSPLAQLNGIHHERLQAV